MQDVDQQQIPNFNAFVGWGFQLLLLAVASWGVTELSSLSRSVQDLNVKMAVVIDHDSTRGDQVKDLEMRVKYLEQEH
jgi:hypothetical protein